MYQRFTNATADIMLKHDLDCAIKRGGLKCDVLTGRSHRESHETACRVETKRGSDDGRDDKRAAVLHETCVDRRLFPSCRPLPSNTNDDVIHSAIIAYHYKCSDLF